jgi:single-stranded-DNA-specific exonuclease
VGAGGAHIKFLLGGLDAIGFQMGERLDLCGGEVEAAAAIGFDEWDGARRLQLRLRDLRRPAPERA